MPDTGTEVIAQRNKITFFQSGSRLSSDLPSTDNKPLLCINKPCAVQFRHSALLTKLSNFIRFQNVLLSFECSFMLILNKTKLLIEHLELCDSRSLKNYW